MVGAFAAKTQMNKAKADPDFILPIFINIFGSVLVFLF
jgi:hypothetical protein